jgi:hypothetical protein
VTTVGAAIGALGGAYMISPEAKAAGKAAGYRGWQFYMRGRGGVLGDVDADVVTAALGFLAPTHVRTAWEAGRAVGPVDEAVRTYSATAAAWGRNRLSGADGLDRLADLLGRVAAAADPAGLPLFAGWRAVPLDDDAPARVVQLAHVLREHRGGAHLVAVLASGLTPLEAVLAGPGGAGNAAFFGWPEPYPQVDEGVRARRATAETLTDALVAPAYATLTDDEAGELSRLLKAVLAHTGLA